MVQEKHSEGRCDELRVCQIEMDMQNQELRRVQSELEELKDRYRDLYDFAPVGYLTLNEKGLILESNLTAAQMLGVERQKLTGMFLSRLVEEEFVNAYHVYLREIFATQTKQTCEIQFAREDGSFFHAQLESVAVQDETGRYNRCRTILSDITERRRAEEALRESEEKFSATFRFAPLPMAITSIEEGRCIDANAACLNTFGYKKTEVVGKTSVQLQFWKNEEERSCRLKQIEAEGCVRNLEKSFRTKDGRLRHGLFSTLKIPLQGRSVLLCSFYDITDRKLAEEELRESAANLSEAQRVAKIGSWTLDLRTKKVRWSDELYRIFGVDKRHFRGSYEWYLSRLHPEDRPVVLQTNAQTREKGTPFDFDYRIITPNGQVKTVREVGYAERDEAGKVVRIFGTTRDITERKRAEEALRLRNAAIESSISGISIAELDGKLAYVNRAALQLWGYDHEEEVLGKQAPSFWLHGKEAEEAVKIAGETGAWIGELAAKRKDGTPLDVQAIITLVRDSDSRPVAIMGSFIDISEHKRDREALRESEERYRRFVETANEGVWAIDEDLRTTFVNQKMAEMLGYAPEEILGKTLLAFMFEEDLPDQHKRIERRKRGEGDTYERRFKCKDGSEAWMLVSATPSLDQDGNFHGSFGMITDITEQRKAAAEVKQQRDFLQQLINTIPTPIFYKDVDGRYLGSNIAYESDTGMSRADIVGKTVFDVAPPYLAQIYHEQDLSLIHNPGVQQGEASRQDAAGTRHEVMFTKAPFWDLEGNIAGMVGVIFDITELKHTQAALQNQISLMESLLEAIPAPVFFKNTDHVYLGCNSAFADFIGLPKESLIGKSVFEVAPRERAEVYRAQDQRLFENPGFQIYETLVTSSDGVLHDVMFHKATFADCSGEVAGLIGVILDITDRKRAEDALKESERRYRLLADNTLDVIWQIDPDLRITYINPAITRLTGYTVDEWIGASLREFCDEENFAKLAQAAQDEISKGPESSGTVVEAEFLKKNKEPVAAEIHGKVIFGDDGLPVRLQGVTRDITERKRAEEALRESEYMLRSILVAAPVGLVLTEKRLIKWANEEWEKMFGFKGESEYVGQPTSIMYGSEAQYKTSRDAIYRSLEKGDVGETYTEFKGKEGTLFQAYLRSTYLDPSDASKGTLSAISDVTEIVRAERACLESEQRYRSLFEESRDGVYAVLRDGEITDANPSFVEIFGYTKEETSGKNIRELYADPSDRSKFQETIEKRGFVKDYEIKFRKKDGTEVDCLVTSSVRFGDDGSIVGYRGIMRDLTIRKGLQRQLVQAQKMEAIGTLAGGIAHDFNNLLQIVLGYSEVLMAEKQEGDSEYADLEKIFHAAKSGAELVRRLLAFSRESESKPVPLNLNQQIVQVEKLLRRTIPRMVDIHLDLSPDLPEIYVDPSQVEQVLMNLALNARDAMPDGGKLTVRTSLATLDDQYSGRHLEVSPGDYVLLEVSDTGHGMDKETVEHIFEPFYTTKEMGRGTGLGLAMVYGIVKQHDGHISVYSEVGKGTVFRVYFPGLEGDEEIRPEASGVMPALGTETVLLVDDEEFVRQLGARILANHGYTVLQAEKGGEALDLFEKENSRIAMVILDLIMPDMGGRECLERLLKIDSNVKVLVASGFSADASVRETLELGAKGFVTKPFRAKKLLLEVHRILMEV